MEITTVPCPFCRKNIGINATTCPHCGAHVQPEELAKIAKAMEEQQQRGCIWGVAVFAVVFMMFCVGFGGPAEDGPARSDPIIEAKGPEFQDWAKNNFSVQDMHIELSTIRIRMAPEMYSTPKNAESVARTIARAWRMRTGRSVNCRVFDTAGRSEIASAWSD